MHPRRLSIRSVACAGFAAQSAQPAPFAPADDHGGSIVPNNFSAPASEQAKRFAVAGIKYLDEDMKSGGTSGTKYLVASLGFVAQAFIWISLIHVSCPGRACAPGRHGS